MKVIKVDIGKQCGYDAAMAAALKAAEAELSDAMLVSWKNNLTGESSPNVDACGVSDLEGWEMYAESRGATLRVEVNGGDYVFIFI